MTTIIVIENITPQVAVEFSQDQGPQGGQGATGPTGPSGPAGATGPDGATGAIAAGRYSYDLVLTSGVTVTRILEGKFIVTGAVTTT